MERTTAGTQYIYKLVRLLLDGGIPILKEIFFNLCPRSKFHEKLAGWKDDLLLEISDASKYKDILFPFDKNIDPEQFDVSLLCILILQALEAPLNRTTSAAQIEPYTRLQNNIETIQNCQGQLHNWWTVNMVISFEEFDKMWALIEKVLMASTESWPPEIFQRMKAKFENLRFSPITENEKERVDQWGQTCCRRKEANYQSYADETGSKLEGIEPDISMRAEQQQECAVRGSLNAFAEPFRSHHIAKEEKTRMEGISRTRERQHKTPAKERTQTFKKCNTVYNIETVNVIGNTESAFTLLKQLSLPEGSSSSLYTLPSSLKDTDNLSGEQEATSIVREGDRYTRVYSEPSLSQGGHYKVENHRLNSPMSNDPFPSAPPLSLCSSLSRLDDIDSHFSMETDVHYRNKDISDSYDDILQNSSEVERWSQLALESLELQSPDAQQMNQDYATPGGAFDERRNNHDDVPNYQFRVPQQRHSIDTGSTERSPVFFFEDSSPLADEIEMRTSTPISHSRPITGPERQHKTADGTCLQLRLNLRGNIALTPRSTESPRANQLHNAIKRCFSKDANPSTGDRQLRDYLENGKKLTIDKVEYYTTGCVIAVIASRQENLEDLWHDFITGDLETIAEQTLFSDVIPCPELEVDIDGSEYKNGCLHFKPTGSRHQDAVDEMYQVLCRHGGSMNVTKAMERLSEESKILAKTSGFFEKCKGKFFIKKDGCTIMASFPRELDFCHYFLLGKCAYKKDCVKSHDVDDSKTNAVLKSLNLEDLSTKKRLDLLRNLACTPPKICVHYNKGNSCTRESTCAFFHVCKYWTTGECRFGNGDTCNKAHNFNNKHEQDLLRRHNLQELSDAKILEYF